MQSAIEMERLPKKPVPLPEGRNDLNSPISPVAKDASNEQKLSETSLNEYAACRFRFDINISTSQAGPSGDHEILMELAANDGEKRLLSVDANMLSFLHEQLEKVEQTFPRCYVYKTNPSSSDGT